LSKTQKSAAIGLLGQGLSQSETARKLGISRQIVSHWVKCPNFQREVEKSRIDFLAAQESQDNQKKPEAIPITTEPITTDPITTTFKSTLRKREVDLLELIESNLLPELLQSGSVRVAAVLLKVCERRSRLLGLDLPNWDLLQSLETLVSEGCANSHQVSIVTVGLDQITKQLKSSMDLNRVTGSE